MDQKPDRKSKALFFDDLILLRETDISFWFFYSQALGFRKVAPLNFALRYYFIIKYKCKSQSRPLRKPKYIFFWH